ncbi:MAG TPA: PilZ domain-containing protein [Candidatus Xenobia bacterium]|nr:PilZ domain-containing protein [Candidatus Xenobia bacterium]
MEQLKALFTQPSYPIENERRSLHRFPLPAALPIEVRWRERVLALNRDPERENISGSGLCFCLKDGETPPVGAELEVRMSLRDYMFQTTGLAARCRGRVVRHDTERRLAVEFSDIVLEPTEGRRAIPFVARPGNGNGNGSHPHFSAPIPKMR